MVKYALIVAAAFLAVAAAAQKDTAAVRFMTIDPGHFHASLVHKEMYPEVSKKIYVYAPLGPDVVEHLNRMIRFNTRAERPTAWEIDVLTGGDFFQRMLKERPGNVAVFSGRNRGKIDYIKSSVENGLNVLSDKPWVIRAEDLPKLESALNTADAKKLIAYDIMTERYEITSILQKEMVNDAAVFGKLEMGSVEDPAVYMKSVHYIMKMVAGAPNLRPPWFFDITQQGEALTDVGTHLVDLVPWTLFPEQPLDYRKDIRMLAASRWPTVISRDDFRKVTNVPEFPAYLREWVRDGKLNYYCNTQVVYALRGAHVKLDILWDYQADHGDTHYAFYRGSKARVVVIQDKEQKYRPETYVVPNSPALKSEVLAAVKARVQALQKAWPGVAVEDMGDKIWVTTPDKYRVGHEFHFAEVTNHFLQYLKNPKALPAWEKPNMLAKYFVTTKGVELSQKNSKGN